MARVNGTAGEISRLDNLKPRGLGLLAVRTLPDFGIFLPEISRLGLVFRRRLPARILLYRSEGKLKTTVAEELL